MKNKMKYENGKEYKLKVGSHEVLFRLENFNEKTAEKINETIAELKVKKWKEREGKTA